VWPSLDEPALRLGDESVTYGELLLLGATTGLLDEARGDTAHALKVLAALREPISADELRKEAEAFRRERKLHSGDDLLSWLGRRGLDESMWREHLRRSIARRAESEMSDEAVDDDESEHALVVDLACRGWWSRVGDLATRLWSAERAIARRGESGGQPSAPVVDEPAVANAKRYSQSVPILGVLDETWCADRLRVFESRRSALDEITRTSSEPAAIEARVREHSVEWVRFEYEEIRLASQAAASEAVMCARDDGLTPEEIAARARVELEQHDLRRDEVPAAIAAMLTGAVPGNVLGPFVESDGVHVVWLNARREPSADDESVRSAAIAELVEGELDRAGSARARAVGPL
jgi:hypothetical protein